MLTNLLVSVLTGIVCMMELLGNAFIVSMNITNWINTMDELNVNNLIVSSLGVTNICHNCLSFAGIVFYLYWKEIFLLHGVYTYHFMLMFFLSGCNLWFATWLCFYYCMKIGNFNHPSLIWMKVRFPKILPWLLMGSSFFSLIVSIPAASGIHLKANKNPLSNLSNYISANISNNGGQTDFELDYGYFPMFIMTSLVASVAFIIFFLSAMVIIISLYRHMKRMVQSADSFRSSTLNAHLCAVKTVTMLLILYMSYYLAQCLIFVKGLEMSMAMLLTCQFVTFAFPALSSIILILGNPTLKKKLTKMFCHLKCCGSEGTWEVS